MSFTLLAFEPRSNKHRGGHTTATKDIMLLLKEILKHIGAKI